AGLGSATTFAAQQDSEEAIPDGTPVAIHSGTCEDYIEAPDNDAGELEQVTTDDVWNDDTFQAGIFNDENLDAAGIDFNGDGQLQADEVITPNGVTADLGRAEADFDDTIDTDEQSVVVVHP